MMEIAVIGGGASGISTIDAINRYSSSKKIPVSVTLFEPKREIGPGIPYAGDGDYALLNRQAHLLSIRSDDPQHFVSWMRHEDLREYANEEFVPRWLFGNYLSAHFKTLVAQSRLTNHPIRVVPNWTTAVYCEEKKYA